MHVCSSNVAGSYVYYNFYIFSDKCHPEIHTCLSEVCTVPMVYIIIILCVTIKVMHTQSNFKIMCTLYLYLQLSKFSTLTVLHTAFNVYPRCTELFSMLCTYSTSYKCYITANLK